jgi:succinate dehydrogenase/fumarate reductase flavoprotein subunit
MHISEIGLCSGHSSSGVWVDEHAATTVPGLYSAGDMACVPHNYMVGAFVYGEIAAESAIAHAAAVDHVDAATDQLEEAHELIYRPLGNPDGPPQTQVEYKLRRFVNDYLAPPKATRQMEIALAAFERMDGEIRAMGGQTPHELMRCVEVSFIRDCAEMAARASLYRTESRWGLYHDRLDFPLRNDRDWFVHAQVYKDPVTGRMAHRNRPVAPYIIPVDGFDFHPVEPERPVPEEPAAELPGQGPSAFARAR